MRIQDKLRASSVARWHIVATSRPQSLAEHQFNVALICDEFFTRTGRTHGARASIMAQALEHDMDEVFEGDTPTAAKHPNGVVKPEGATEQVIKMADLIEAYCFISEFGAGRHAAKVVGYCSNRVMEAKQWFTNPDQAVWNDLIWDLTEGDIRIS